MRLIVAGSRTIRDKDFVWEKLDFITDEVEITEVISGGAPGVDRLGESWAIGLNLPLTVMPADWANEGRSAGYKRNVKMAERADALIAIWDGKSKGTQHMIDIAREHGLNVRIVRYDIEGDTE